MPRRIKRKAKRQQSKQRRKLRSIIKSAVTGLFVSEREAARHPRTTFKQKLKGA
jgi:hypothetical protein